MAGPQILALIYKPLYSIKGIIAFRLGWLATTTSDGFGITHPTGQSVWLIPFLKFTWVNFSLLLLLPLTLLLLYRKITDQTFRILSITAASLWLIPHLIKFQYMDFDNNKLFVYAAMFSVIAVGIAATQYEKYYKSILATLWLTVVVTIPSSIWEIKNDLSGSQETRTLITAQEKAVGDWIQENTNPDASFITSAVLLQELGIWQRPALIWSGRKGTMGLPGSLQTHGIDFRDRASKQHNFLKKPLAGATILQGIPADYILVDGFMRLEYPNLEKDLATAGYKTLYTLGEFSVVALH